MHRAPLLALALAAPFACGGGPGDADATDATDATSDSDTTSATDTADPHPLIDHALWAPADPATDPLAAHRPPDPECGLGGWYIELGELEVNTAFCAYADLVQPALVPVPAGARLHLALRHYDLTAPAPAEAHAALFLGDALVWERLIPVPGPAAVYNDEVTLPAPAPLGAPVRLHLHNHGQNTWIFGPITITP